MSAAEVIAEIRDIIEHSWLNEAGRYRQIVALIEEYDEGGEA